MDSHPDDQADPTPDGLSSAGVRPRPTADRVAAVGEHAIGQHAIDEHAIGGDATREAGIRDAVREGYARAALTLAGRPADGGGGCCGPATVLTPARAGVFGTSLYDAREVVDVPVAAVGASLGCGVPTQVAELRAGETVLDLGSGAGADVLISARRVSPGGRAIGLDMTPEMLDLARRNAADAGVDNAEFIQGYLEDIPLPDDSVDVIISNCVINLAADKGVVAAEAFRVLRPGGRLAVSDVIAADDMPDDVRAEMQAWTGCIAGALTEADYRTALAAAGFDAIEITATHQVHEAAWAATIRACKPPPTPSRSDEMSAGTVVRASDSATGDALVPYMA